MLNVKRNAESERNVWQGKILHLTVGYLRSCPCRYFKLRTNVEGQFCKYLVSGSLLTELKFKIWEHN